MRAARWLRPRSSLTRGLPSLRDWLHRERRAEPIGLPREGDRNWQVWHGRHLSMSTRAALVRFGLLFSVLYVAFGAASPFFPAFLSSRGLTADQIGFALALGSACRLAAGPVAGRLADGLHALRSVLSLCCLAAAVVGFAFLLAHGFSLLLLLGLCYAAMLAPTTSLADALALRAASGGAREGAREGASNQGRPEAAKFEYGWVRGAGSAAFI